MAQHSHFHLPGEFPAGTDPHSRRNSLVELAVVLCLEGGNWLDCIPLGLVEERIGHLAARTDAAYCPVAGANQELVDSTRALHRTLPALRLVEE
jgi:hypothetical protein